MSKIQAAVITPVLAAGSVASPYDYQVNITQRLCYGACVDNSPVFIPQFSLVGYSSVGTDQYVATIQVQGVIAYVPCGGGCGCTKAQPLSQTFTIPFYSATAPTAVSIEMGSVVNSIVTTACQSCSRTFVSETPLSLTVTTTT